MSAVSNETLQRVKSWQSLVVPIALRYKLDPLLVLAVICQESAGDPGAVRVERGFWSRYAAAIAAEFKATLGTQDDRWLRYPDLVSASYGLMQVLYVVAVERGMSLSYPTSLCDPTTGIEAGCRQLKWCLERTAGIPITPAIGPRDAALRRALLRYNGGGNLAYPDEVLAWRAAGAVTWA